MPAARRLTVRSLLLLVLLLAATWACGTQFAAAQSDALSWPDRRFAPCAAFDEVHGDWYVFGGRAEGAGRHLADAWGIDLRRPAPRWERVAAADAPAAPPAVRSCAAAYDTDRGRMLVFGGWDGVTPTNGVWALSPGPAPRWERLCDTTSCGEPPTARRAAQAVYDPVGRRLLVFGGLDTQYRNDLWELDARRRARLAPAPRHRPAARTARRSLADVRRGAPARLAVRRHDERPGPRRHLGARSRRRDLGARGDRRARAPLGRGPRARRRGRAARAARRLGVRPEPLPARHVDARRSRRHARLGARGARQRGAAAALLRRRRLRPADPPDGRVRRGDRRERAEGPGCARPARGRAARLARPGTRDPGHGARPGRRRLLAARRPAARLRRLRLRDVPRPRRRRHPSRRHLAAARRARTRSAGAPPPRAPARRTRSTARRRPSPPTRGARSS